MRRRGCGRATVPSRAESANGRRLDPLGKDSAMMRALVLPLAVMSALATGLGLLGLAATITQAPVVVVVTATATPAIEATQDADALPATEPFAADVTMLVPDGLVVLRVTRLALPPGALLPPERAAAPAALIAEVGEVGVRTYATLPGTAAQEPNEVRADAVLRRGEHLNIPADTVRTVRNASAVPAVVLVVAIEPLAGVSASP
jgi:hypothetical protein